MSKPNLTEPSLTPLQKAQTALLALEKERATTTTQLLKGFEIIEKYEPGAEVSSSQFQIWAGSEGLLFQMTEVEAKTMCQNRWFIDEDFGCWTIVIYN